MRDQDCIFCKVIHNELPSFKIWEDENSIAILDIFPNTKGQTLVIPKSHLPSYQFDLDDKDYSMILNAAKSVGKLLEKKMDVKRVALVIEGMGVNHLHVKLYPLHGLSETFTEMWAKEKVYFEKYEGYISTNLGPRADDGELEKIAEHLRA